MGYYNLERAARDPYYRMMYEAQKRQESEARHAAKVKAAFDASQAKRAAARQQAAASSFSFTPPPSPASPAASSTNAPAGPSIRPNSSEPDGLELLFRWLVRFFGPFTAYGIATFIYLKLFAWLFGHTTAQYALVLLFFAMSVGFAVRYWRRVAALGVFAAAVAAGYYGVQWF